MDKFILITGGTKGIGKAVASCLGKAGYNLILTYASDQAAAEEVRSELVGRFDIQVSILRADISDRNTIGVIDSFLEENRLRLDGLVFNAGMTCRDPFEELSFEDWERVFFANIHFPVFLLQKIVGRMDTLDSVWKALDRGTVFILLEAVSGIVFLFIQSRRSRSHASDSLRRSQ